MPRRRTETYRSETKRKALAAIVARAIWEEEMIEVEGEEEVPGE
jgi:hypothetical protein